MGTSPADEYYYNLLSRLLEEGQAPQATPPPPATVPTPPPGQPRRRGCIPAWACTVRMYAAVLNSCNAAAAATADDEEAADLFFVLFEEGRLTPVALPYGPAALADEATAGRRRSGGHPLSPAWKIAIRSFVAAATLAAAAFIVSLIPSCRSWSEAGPLLASLVMLPMIGAFVWALTLDYFGDPDYHRKEKNAQITSSKGGR